MLYSYVIEHDHGFAPHPRGRYCTLVHCKFGGKYGRRNIVELANVGDWIVGTGGKSRLSAGNGKIIYFMRVDEKLKFEDYLTDSRFEHRLDRKDLGLNNKFALVSRTFWYFGRGAINIQKIPRFGLLHPLEKRGPWFRSDFNEKYINSLTHWFENNYSPGIHDEPCSPLPSIQFRSKCMTKRIVKNKVSCYKKTNKCQ